MEGRSWVLAREGQERLEQTRKKRGCQREEQSSPRGPYRTCLSSIRQKGPGEELWPLLGFTVGTVAGVFIAPFVACLVFTADLSGFRELRKISIF